MLQRKAHSRRWGHIHIFCRSAPENETVQKKLPAFHFSSPQGRDRWMELPFLPLSGTTHTSSAHTHTPQGWPLKHEKHMHTLALQPILAHFFTDPIYLCNSSENKPIGSPSLMAAFPPVPLKDRKGCQQSACLERRSKDKTNAFWTESASLCYHFSKNICFTRQWAGHR